MPPRTARSQSAGADRRLAPRHGSDHLLGPRVMDVVNSRFIPVQVDPTPAISRILAIL